MVAESQRFIIVFSKTPAKVHVTIRLRILAAKHFAAEAMPIGVVPSDCHWNLKSR
jgi:hypothetical protein